MEESTQMEFDGTINRKPFKFYAEEKIGDKNIYVSIYDKSHEFFKNKKEPIIRLSVNRNKEPKWEILRNIGGVHLFPSALDDIARKVIKEIETINRLK